MIKGFEAVEYIDSLADAGVESKQAKVMDNTIDNLAKENYNQIEKMARDRLIDVAIKQDIRLLEKENALVR